MRNIKFYCQLSELSEFRNARQNEVSFFGVTTEGSEVAFQYQFMQTPINSRRRS